MRYPPLLAAPPAAAFAATAIAVTISTLCLHALILCCCQMPPLASSFLLRSALPHRPQRSAVSWALGGTSKPKIAVVGGGLAGLSTAFHLLEKTAGECHVTVFDRASVGTAGASSVAGGLVHPLSPRGKLVHWGREGLDATNRLIAEACQSLAAGAADESASSSRIVLRDELYRLAITDQHVQQLQTTAVNLPDYCEWKTADELLKGKIVDETANVLGALRLFNGCRVIHVPSYLQGLWIACRERGAVWKIVDADTSSRSSMAAWKDRLQDFDVVVLAAGSGLFDSSSSGRSSLLLSKQTELPVQLVRGQSVEIRSPQQRAPSAALLCGKYVSPTPDPNVTLVGATHEFQAHAATPDTVVTELQERTADFSPELWKTGQVERRTVGYRVQSERGMNGRMPIIGQLQSSSSTTTAASKLEGDLQEVHPNMWVFTGLSSRGLLFHGLYGDILTDAILQNSEEPMLSRCRDLDWWRRRPKKKPTSAREQPL